MKIYVVMVYNDKGMSRVSQEGYRNIVDAQKFCGGRDGAIKINEFLYMAPDCWYVIVEVNVF